MRECPVKTATGRFDAEQMKNYKDFLQNYEDFQRKYEHYQTELQHLRAALASLPDKIMNMKWTDTEELTFPLDNPTAEEQNEWLNEFIDRLDMHVRNTIEIELEALSTTTEPTNTAKVLDE